MQITKKIKHFLNKILTWQILLISYFISAFIIYLYEVEVISLQIYLIEIIVFIFFLFSLLGFSIKIFNKFKKKKIFLLIASLVALYIMGIFSLNVDSENPWFISIWVTLLTIPVLLLIFLFFSSIKNIFRLFKKIFLKIFSLISRITKNKRLRILVNKYLIFVILIGSLAVFGWRNWHLTKRVNRLEEVIGESRLFCNEKQAVDKVKNSVVRIISRSGQGSGFVVRKNKKLIGSTSYILTNWHVVSMDTKPKIVLPDYTIIQGETVGANESADLALIKVEEGMEEIEALEIGEINNLEELDELIAVGYPLGTDIHGEATTNKGYFVALRQQEGFSEKIVQTDLSLGYGMSGGPLIDICGKVYGINSQAGQGLSFAISIDGYKDLWYQMSHQTDPLADIEKIEFKPNENALECVKAFYNYQTNGELKKAYDLLAENYTHDPFDKWKKGYENTMFIVFVKSEPVEDKENKIAVKFYSADLIDEKMVYKYFEGTHSVKEDDGELKLEGSDIKQIEQPGWEWYYDYDFDSQEEET